MTQTSHHVDLLSLDRVSFLDPASGKATLRRVAARSAIVTVGQDHEGRIFVLDVFAQRIPVPGLVDKLFAINAAFRPRLFGGEADALQTLFQEAVKLIAHDRQQQLPLVPVQHSTKVDKDFRIRSILQPVIAEGRLILHDAQHELLAELEGFPSYPTKDIVDALASAIDLLPAQPLRKVQDQQRDALAQYLRQTGAPSWYIDQKCGPTAFASNPVRAMMANRHRLRRPLPPHLQA